MVFDPLLDERVAPGSTIRRDAKDNPLIVPRGETVPIAYTRASSLSKYLAEDSWSLSKWRERYLAQGIAKNPDLAMRAAAVHYSTGPLTGTMPISERKRAAEELDAVGDEAKQRAGISEAANVGTAGHSLTEPGNQGEIHDGLIDVVKGYNIVTAGFERVASEVFVANDLLRVAGTFDSLYLSPEFPGFCIIGDTKTGKNYHQAEFEIQLAGYAGGEVYLGDPEEREGEGRIAGDGRELPVDQRLTFEEFAGLPVLLHTAYLVHVSVTGAPKPRVIKLDLERGRRLALQCAATRDARAELDKIGIGEKVDHIGLAKQVLETAWEELCSGERSLTHTEFRARALALHGRFEHIWPDEYTFAVKERLG